MEGRYLSLQEIQDYSFDVISLKEDLEFLYFELLYKSEKIKKGKNIEIYLNEEFKENKIQIKTLMPTSAPKELISYLEGNETLKKNNHKLKIPSVEGQKKYEDIFIRDKQKRKENHKITLKEMPLNKKFKILIETTEIKEENFFIYQYKSEANFSKETRALALIRHLRNSFAHANLEMKNGKFIFRDKDQYGNITLYGEIEKNMFYEFIIKGVEKFIE